MPETGALLAVLIVERPLCVDCIAEKSAFRTDEIEPLLSRIATRIAITSAVDRCKGVRRDEESLRRIPCGVINDSER